MTLNLTHQKTPIFKTQAPSSLCATKDVKKYWLLSVAVRVLINLDVVLWWFVSCIPVQNSGYSTSFKLAVSSDMSANSSNNTNPHLSTQNVQEFPKSLRTTSNSRCLCTKFSCLELDTSGQTYRRLPPLKKYSSL